MIQIKQFGLVISQFKAASSINPWHYKNALREVTMSAWNSSRDPNTQHTLIEPHLEFDGAWIGSLVVKTSALLVKSGPERLERLSRAPAGRGDGGLCPDWIRPTPRHGLSVNQG